MMSFYYVRQRVPPELRSEIDRVNAEHAALIHRALGRLTDGAIVATEAVIEAARRWRAGRRRRRREIAAIRELGALDDRSLQDIGLQRDGIRAAVRSLEDDARRTRSVPHSANAAPRLTVIRGRATPALPRTGELRDCA
jgi:uncharacterized protein YjiS (DUF1127 family)